MMMVNASKAAQAGVSLATVSKTDGNMYELELKQIVRYMKSQDLLFWLVMIYLLLEYGRPQTIYPALNILPFAQIVILLATVWLFFKKSEPFVANVLNRFLFMFFVVIVLSSAFALSPETSFEKVPDFIAWMLIYFIIINIVNTENRFLVFVLLFLLLNFKMAQFSFRGWAGVGFGFAKDGTGGGPGWFQNSGEFGIAMCVFLPLAYCFFMALRNNWPTWKKGFFFLLPLFALTGIVSSSSRGAVVGGLAVLVWFLLKRKRWFVASLVVGSAVIILYLIMPSEQVSRFESAGKDHTSTNRIERWEKGLNMANAFPVLGVGYENWAIADKRLFDGNGAFSHNVFIQCVSELGYSGLLVYTGMVLFVFVVNSRTRKIFDGNLQKQSPRFIPFMAAGLDGALVGYLSSGFFVTVLFYPYFWILLAMTVALNNVAEKQRM